MSHYEERLERDLKMIRGRVAEVKAEVDVAVRNGVNALLRLDRKLAAQTILGDHPINRATREIDRLCHAFVARHLPSAGILRYVSSVLRLTVVLERIGDYGVTIARESVQLTEPAPESVAHDIEMLCDQSLRMLRSAMQAFEEGSADRALGTKSVEPVDPTTALRLTGYQVGGISPFGTRRPLPVCMERSIGELPRIYVNGGRRGLLVGIEPAVLMALLGPTPVDVAR